MMILNENIKFIISRDKYFFASFLIPVIGGIVSIPLGLIGAWIYYDYKK